MHIINKRKGRMALLAAVALLIAGCATQHASIKPDTSLPAAWATSAGADQQIAADWWSSFGSPELNHFIQTAQAQSLDVAAAVARVRQAEASARVAGAALLPALSATANASREARLGGRASVDGNAFDVGLAASYEVDFWGRNRAAHDSATVSLQASLFDRDTIRLTVLSGVANAWLLSVSLQERVAISQANLENANRLLKVVEARTRAGAATQLELAQQRGLVATQKTSVAALRQQEQDARSALSLLLGQAGAPAIATQSLSTLQVPLIGAGVPSALLARRPDVARAEAELQAAHADVQQARAAMLPSLSLTAGIGGSADRIGRVFDNPIYSLAAGLTAPIFNGGRLAAGRDLAMARQEELLADYRSAIVSAFTDVDIALNAVAGSDAQTAAHTEQLAQAQRALQLAERRYRAGAETLLVLLDAQRTLYAAQDTAVQLRLARMQASVSLYKALGGGWRVPPSLAQSS